MKKIIIIYSTAGMGHKKAAMAVLKILQDKEKDGIEVKAIDLLEYASKAYKFLYTTFYIFIVSHFKWLWKAIYYSSNHPVVDSVIKKIREVLDLRSLKKLEKMLLEERPDAIIATHFLLTGIAESLKELKGFDSRIYAVVTDYGPHSYWLSEGVDRFFVGSEFTSSEVVKRGIPPEKITITGIPTLDEFCGELDTGRLREVYGLDKTKKTIFLLSGGFGVGPMEKILFSLNSCRADIQVIAVCGHNKAAYEDIQGLSSKLKYPVILFGFTDKVAELMSVSDLMITKAGGISVTEAMNMRLPMVLFASIPGQETWNECLLLDNGAAERARSVKDIPVIVDRILLSEDVRDGLKANIDKIRRPDAAGRIADTVLKEIGG